MELILSGAFCRLPGVAPSLDTAHKSAPTLGVWKKDAWKLGEVNFVFLTTSLRWFTHD